MRSWTSLDKFTAIEMARSGASASEIGRKLGRSVKSIETWFKRQQQNGYSYRLAGRRWADDHQTITIDATVIPPFVIADLDRRMSIMPTLDHLLFGTPLPTCSALDRPAGLYYAR